MKPNILILHCDQLRYDGIGCNGNPHARTPHVDALAADGTVFSRHIAANPICMPSRASFFTGQYVPGHNVWINGVPLQRADDYGPLDERKWPFPGMTAGVKTMPDVFAEAGYDTVSLGKLHLTPNRAAREYGFGENWPLMDAGGIRDWHGPYYGFRHVEITRGHAEKPCISGHYADWLETNHPAVRAAALGTKPATAFPLPNRHDIYASPVPGDLHNSIWLADRFAEYVKKRDTTKPFFAFVGFPDPHNDFTPSADIVAQFEDADVIEPGDPDGRGWQDSPMHDHLQKHNYIGSPAERRVIVRYTYAMIHNIDRAVGKIIATLKARGLWDNTVIVFTSDHGDFLGDHALLLKALIGSDSLLHVPFVLRAPGAGLPARVAKPMSNTEVLPMLAGLAGLPGSSVRLGGSEALAHCYAGNPAQNNFTIYDERYRLTTFPCTGYVEMFDHQEDPHEMHNVAREPRLASYRDALLQRLTERTLQCTNPILNRLGAW